MKKILTALIVGLFVFGFSSLAFAQLIINEVDADQTGTDSAEFIELYDGGAGNTSLDGYVIVLYNGSNDLSYDAIDLDTYSTDANGYFVIGSATVPNVDMVEFTTNGIQNGADAVALYTGDATDFPTGTAVTTTNLIDALVYDTDDGDDPGLLVLLNASEPQINENENGNAVTESMQRSPNGSGGARNTSTYTTDIPTPGTQNPAPPTTATLTRAYSISGTAMDVVYDISITSVDPGDYSLTGTASITFSGAAIDGTDDTIVHLTGASASMVADLTLDNIDDSANTTNYDFYAGTMPIANTNTNNPGGIISDLYDATFTGIISANDAYNNVWISDASGAYNGVMIYSSSFDALVNVGDEVLIASQRDTYNGLTELINPILISTITTGNTPYGPTIIDGSDINENITVDTNPGEKWEGQLVKIENFHVDSYTDYDYTCSWSDGGGKTTYYFHVGDNVDYQFGVFSLIVGETYQEMTGVIDWYNSGPYYRINPRDNDDQTLPVELSSFTAVYTINEAGYGNVTLNWTTASETDVIGFNIFRNIGETYGPSDKININTISGQGTSTQMHTYSFIDEEADIYTSYHYWLEVVNLGGTNDIHGPIEYKSIDIDGNGEMNIITGNLNPCYPNPVQPGDEIRFKFMVGGLEGNTKYVELKVYNVLGELVAEIVNENRMVNEYTETWVPRNLSPGVYLYQLKTENFNEVKKMVIVR